MKKLFVLLTLLIFIGVQGFSQGNPAEWRREGNKTWFKDFKTYNGFGTTTPTYPWHFVGNMYVNGTITGTTGIFTAITLNGNALSTTLGTYELSANKLNSSSVSTTKYPTWYAVSARMDSIAALLQRVTNLINTTSTSTTKYYSAAASNARQDSIALLLQRITNLITTTSSSTTKYYSAAASNARQDSIAALLARIASPTFTGLPTFSDAAGTLTNNTVSVLDTFGVAHPTLTSGGFAICVPTVGGPHPDTLPYVYQYKAGWITFCAKYKTSVSYQILKK